MRGGRSLLLTALLLVLAGCSVKLPDPHSEGAQLYARRCNNCHRLYAPQSMTYAMWKIQVDRMQGEMARRGVPPLSSKEYATILAYLKRHSE